MSPSTADICFPVPSQHRSRDCSITSQHRGLQHLFLSSAKAALQFFTDLSTTEFRQSYKNPQKPQVHYYLPPFFFCPGHFPALLYQRFHVLFSTTRFIKSVLITLPGLLFPPFLLGYSTEYKPSCVLNNLYLGKSLMEFSD